MAAQRSSASKRQRDIDKRSRAAEKRDRRQRKSDPATDDPSDVTAVEDGAVQADSGAILERIEQLQREFDADVIDFETYDARKAELLSHIQI
ncbi:MAG TPA: hypothetical protein VK215_01430 [Acidimicrobiales bacterium]|jgi:hypothetical protein|nr:hypothetical protein [Acidimicrobiales bacterium]HLN41083.1 hypothetical protein [Acidimicrobiales bacterium]